MDNVANTWSQIYPPKPQFTEANLTDLSGKVYIVTGSNTGIGKLLAQILFSKNAKVYIAARSEEKAQNAIDSMKQAFPESKGELSYLHLDLADLTTIKASVNRFLAKETKLHVLWNNAGVMMCPQGSKTTQGYELQLGTNNVGAFMFTKLLTPILVATARSEPPNSVRVIWVSSSAAEGLSDKRAGVDMSNLDYHEDKNPAYKYGTSKAGNFYHAAEFARKYGKDGIVSVALNPGNLETDLARHLGWVMKKMLKLFLQHPPILGAYTELFAGLSPEVTVERVKTDNWIAPWGRFAPIRKDMNTASKPKSEGGTGLAEEWWQWNEDQIRSYL